MSVKQYRKMLDEMKAQISKMEGTEEAKYQFFQMVAGNIELKIKQLEQLEKEEAKIVATYVV